MYDDVLEDIIFSDFLVSAKVSVDPCEVFNEVKAIVGSDEGVTLSNGPETWHSTVDSSVPDGALGDCIQKSLTFADEYVRRKFDRRLSENFEWWVNASHFGGYNSPHVHGKSDLIGLYYVKVPDETSDLIIMRNDGSNYSPLYQATPNAGNMRVTPIEGRFYMFPGHLWHYVEAQVNEDERVSMSFNMYVIP